MSRVDEALRRAAEQAERADVRTEDEEVLPAFSPGDAADLAREPFPLEMPERRPIPFAVASPPPRCDTDGPRTAPQPVLAESLLERIDVRLAEKVVVDQNMLPVSREQYRRLAATLHHRQTADGLKVVMVASAVAGEGKTLTASNLALTLSESYQRDVLLVDADLRQPTLHEVFRLDNSTGLSEGLGSPDQRPLPVLQVSPHLAVLTAGPQSADPMAGLTSERMIRLVQEARDRFDWVIIDTPPVGLLPDANLLASMVDGVVFVVSAASTRHDLVRRALDAIGRDRMLGVVLNRAETHLYGYDSAMYQRYSATQSSGLSEL